MLEAPIMLRPEVLVSAAGSPWACPEDMLHPGVPVLLSFPPPVMITGSSQNGTLQRSLDTRVVMKWAKLSSKEAEIYKKAL